MDPNSAFLPVAVRKPTKNVFLSKFFLPVCTFTLVFKGDKLLINNKILEIIVFLYMFCLLVEGSGSKPFQIITDPDSGCP